MAFVWTRSRAAAGIKGPATETGKSLEWEQARVEVSWIGGASERESCGHDAGAAVALSLSPSAPLRPHKFGGGGAGKSLCALGRIFCGVRFLRWERHPQRPRWIGAMRRKLPNRCGRGIQPQIQALRRNTWDGRARAELKFTGARRLEWLAINPLMHGVGGTDCVGAVASVADVGLVEGWFEVGQDVGWVHPPPKNLWEPVGMVWDGRPDVVVPPTSTE